MSDRFDLEQKIMGCWSIVDELKLIADYSKDGKTTDMLYGLAELYQLKFEDTFECFEKSLQPSTTASAPTASWTKMDYTTEDFNEKPRKNKKK